MDGGWVLLDHGLLVGVNSALKSVFGEALKGAISTSANTRRTEKFPHKPSFSSLGRSLRARGLRCRSLLK